MNTSSKNLALYLLSLSGAFRLGRWVSRHRLVVLTYHRVLPARYQADGARPPDSLLSWEFERQIAYLVQRYHVVTGDEVRAFLNGTGHLPAYSVLITFDDGYENNYTVAFPILRQYGVSAIFFLATSQIGQQETALWFDRLYAVLSTVPGATIISRLTSDGAPHDIQDTARLRLWLKHLPQPDRDRVIVNLERTFGLTGTGATNEVVSKLMSWEQVRDMVAQGMTVGSHTASHQILASASPGEVRDELVMSRQHIEDEIRCSCWCFSYPNGTAADFRPSDQAAAQSAGYLCAFTQIPGFITAGTDHYALPRISLPNSGDMRLFLSHLTGVHHSLQSVRAAV